MPPKPAAAQPDAAKPKAKVEPLAKSRVRDEEVLPLAFEPSSPGSPLPRPLAAPRPSEQSRRLELAAVILSWGSGGFAALAIVGAAVPAARIIVLASALAGLLSGLAGLATSFTLGTLRHLRGETSGGTVYDRLRGVRSLRVTSALLQFLSVAAWILVGMRVLSRLGLGPSFESPLVERGLLVLIAAVGTVAALAHLQSLRTPTVRDRSGPTWIVIGIAAGASLVLGVIAALALVGEHPTAGSIDWERDDVAFLVLAAFAALAMALRRTRGLPSATSLLADEPLGERGTVAVSRTKAVLVPTILAFALLLLVFMLVLLFGIGIGELITTVGRNPLVLGALVFLVVALLGSLGLAMMLSRSAERDAPLYAKLPDRKVRQVRWLLGVSGVVAGALTVLAVLSFMGTLDEDLVLHFVCFALLTALGPYGFYIAREANRIRRLEERFPDFLRDIASSHKGGLTLHQSVTIAARGEYGPLTPEVRKMADQLSWNVSFHEALERFSSRVETPLVQRAVNLILQADKSGGSTTDVLLAAARDAREIKNLENERRQTMSLYTIVVYITFFVFLSVAATLYGQFAPAIVESSRAVQGSAIEVEDIGQASLSLRDYQLFYFVAAIVQAIGDGIVGGLLGSGKASLGLRHGFLMVLATYVTFILLL
ncbi:MAG: type II secretion system F family protein [Candidatus Thermoplasmatota archaeon]